VGNVLNYFFSYFPVFKTKPVSVLNYLFFQNYRCKRACRHCFYCSVLFFYPVFNSFAPLHLLETVVFGTAVLNYLVLANRKRTHQAQDSDHQAQDSVLCLLLLHYKFYTIFKIKKHFSLLLFSVLMFIFI